MSLRLRLAQIEVRPGRPAENTARILEHVAAARADRVDLLLLPEMAVPGYLLGDEWEREAFLRDCERCGEEIRAAAEGIAVVFGNVAVDWTRRNEDGRVRKYNALFAAEGGRLQGPEHGPYPYVVKALMPNYREFDDSRHFHDLRKLALEHNRPFADLCCPIRLCGRRVAGILCEDAWDSDYAVSPLRELARHSPDLVVNLSCSPFTAGKNGKRNRVFSAHAGALGVPLAYVNNTGIQNNGKTVFTFDGSSCVYDARGHQVPLGRMFEEGALTLDLPDRAEPFGAPLDTRPDGPPELLEAVRYGTRKFMDLCGVRTVTVGISGGIDSAVVAAIYRSLLSPDKLLLVNMPGPFTSRTTRNLALELAENLGAYYGEVGIADSVDVTRRQVNGLPIRSIDGRLAAELKLTDFMVENVQARDRSSRILSAVSAAFGGVFTCNANKSEMTVGYTTLYGDLGGYLANISDLWKMEVYALADHINAALFPRPVIPAGTIKVKPSAELSPSQDVDRNLGDPLEYPYHDRLFATWVERWNRATPEDVLDWYAAGTLERELAYDGRVADLFPTADAFVKDLERWWNCYQGIGVFKRIQAPPVLAVKRRAFGFDHREAQMGPRYTRGYADRKRALLG